MVDPWNDLNKALRDQEDRFTKREMMAMYFMSALIGKTSSPDPAEAISYADTLLEKLRHKRS